MEAYKGSKLLVTGTGNVTDEVWVEYIKRQTPPKLDDNQGRLCPPNGGPNPALSRNSKPPPFRRWSVHENELNPSAVISAYVCFRVPTLFY